MNRKLFETLGLVALSFAIAGTAASVRAKGPAGERLPARAERPRAADPHVAQFADCAKACDDCARICNMCAAHCTKMLAEGKKEHLDTARTCPDCATICRSASAIVIKGGPFSDLICTACADACKRCGDACEKLGANDPVMKQCADECRTCEKACRAMMRHTSKPEK